MAAFSWALPSDPPLTLRVTAFAKSSTARAAEGLLTNQKELADAYYARRQEEKERRRAEEVRRGGLARGGVTRSPDLYPPEPLPPSNHRP